jgi:glycosyltransferase involved in cell wall biosynthesis
MAEPRITFALVCYEHQDFVAAAVGGALAQEGIPLDIVISDDASKDRTWDEIGKAVAGYRGPHRVRLNRNPANMGMEHYNRIVELAEGDIVVIAHGDDVSLPHRAARLVEVMQREKVSLVTSDAYVAHTNGERAGTLGDTTESRRFAMGDLLTKGWQRSMLGATMAWRREVMTRFGGLDRSVLPAGYDLPMVFRATLLDGAYFLGEPLIEWRRHQSNLSEQLTDRSAGRLIESEGAAGHAVMVLMAMLNDLEYLRRHNPARDDLPLVRRDLHRFMLRHLRNWTRRRNLLFNEGKRATWLDREEWLARRKPDSPRIKAQRPVSKRVNRPE